MKIKRVYHHHSKMEEYKSNMWRVVEDKEYAVSESARLMIASAEFERACYRVIHEWPFSTEAALSATVINHQAWIGHAACALNHGAPEDLTRQAWRTLTEEQQVLANAAADRAIDAWRSAYVAN
jgi:hypothetical protein